MARKKSEGEIRSHQQHLLMAPSEVEAIDDWAFANRIRSRGDAIRRLCQIGMATERNGRETLHKFSRLNEALSVYLDAAPVTDEEKAAALRHQTLSGDFEKLTKDQVLGEFLMLLEEVRLDIHTILETAMLLRDGRSSSESGMELLSAKATMRENQRKFIEHVMGLARKGDGSKPPQA